MGSGCRIVLWYVLALRDCKCLFEMAGRDFVYKMTLLDTRGGILGETHSVWNPTKVRLSEH